MLRKVGFIPSDEPDSYDCATLAEPMAVCPDSEATEPLLCDLPVTLVTPPGYDGTQAQPLLILLHGYGYSGQRLDQGFSLSQTAGLGNTFNTIRAWLGHVSLETTNRYAEVDLEMKARALETCALPNSKTQPTWHNASGSSA